jgi:hypothetical protein
MGEAKRRKDAILKLKESTPEEAARWRQFQDDRRSIVLGINPESQDINVPAATARALSTLLKEAKATGTVEGAVTLLYDTVKATVLRLADVPIACKQGCSHCCYTWVSVSAPEALHIAKLVRSYGDTVMDRVRSAHDKTKDYDFDGRNHPHPCPLLDGDICSIYEHRPTVCRMAASADAAICGRSYHYLSDEDIPMPIMYMRGRTMYGMALTASLKHVGLPHHAYEFNAALVRALDTDRAEQRWLAGEDIFAGVNQDPEDVLSNPATKRLYEQAFPTL